MKKKRLLLVSPRCSRGGNETTVCRIAEILSKKHDVTRTKSESTPKEVENIFRRVNPDLMICIHAVRSGTFLDCEIRPTTILVLGGTDVNVYAKRDKRMEADVRRRCGNAEAVVSFTKELEIFRTKCHVIIPQGVRLSSPSVEDMYQVQNIYDDLSDKGSKRVLLLLAGLRPVKDVLYLVDHAEKSFSTIMKGFVLVIVGPTLDEDYANLVRKRTKDMTCVKLISGNGLSHSVACGLLRKCDGLVNSSLSEGSSVAITEAFAMGRPLVLARDIPANRATLRQGADLFQRDDDVSSTSSSEKTFEQVGCGIVYNSPHGFLDAVKEYFVNNVTKREKIVKHGPRIAKSLNETEYERWNVLVNDLLRCSS